MNFKWLKSILPKGFYGRAVLILVVPVVTIQVVVSVVFIQRHFEDVTRQMTRNMALEVRHIVALYDAADTLEQAISDANAFADFLAIDVEAYDLDLPPLTDSRIYYDLSGSSVISTFHDRVPEVKGVALSHDLRRVHLYLEGDKGPYSIFLTRSRVSASNPHQLLVLMIATSILMTVISFLFLRIQVRSLKRLADAAEAFGKGRSLAYNPSGATEVRSAGRAFIEMRTRIERHIEQRTLMLSGVSHDLRTPLTRLRLGLSLLDQNAETLELSGDIDDMEMMLDEFLAFAGGGATEEITDVDPVQLARDAVENAKRGNDTVELVLPDLPDGAIELRLRPMAVRRAIDNLISNAHRYGENVRLSLVVNPQNVLFVVEDDGPSIPEDRREEAMMPFTRLDRSRNQNRGSGVGLGLSIAVDIASSQGGALTLSDSHDLGGLMAVIRLPR